ncbi:MAG TPA: glycosyltransferase family 4 protein [Flavobacterium sp.]|nr:glycosyltransferase family 4 protein [Flavobacterium sp.]
MKNLLYIGNKLSGKGANVTTIETLGTLLAGEGYTVFYASEKKNPLLRLADMIFSVLRYRKQVDFVLIDTYSTSGFWFAFLVSQLCRQLSIEYIPILHGGNLPVRLKNNPKLSAMVFGNAYRNVAPSNYLYSEFKTYGFTNILFIPNVLELKKYPYKERTTLAPKLLWLRAFDKIYNPKMAVAVLAEVKKTYPEATLHMVGPDRDGSMEICKAYVEENDCNVFFTGRLAKEEWIAIANQCDIFINTTHLDNTPVSVMEAMALGLPVVSTNVGGIPFLLKDKEEGFLVNDGDVQAMADKVKRLVENSDDARFIVRNARKKAESWDWNVVKLLWNDLLSENH